MENHDYLIPEDPVPQWIMDAYDPDEHFFDVANALFDLYIGYKGRYVMSYDGHMFVPKTKDGEDIRLDNRAICNHLNHKATVSIYAGSMTSKFICFDVDDGSQDTVRKLMDSISYAGFDRSKIYVSTSGGKGFHIEMFFDKVMYTFVLRSFYEYICRDANVDTTHVEFRPTAKQAIKLPLGIHYVTKNVCWYLDPDTLEPIKDPRYILGIKKYNCEDSYKLIRFLVGDNEFFRGTHRFSGKDVATPTRYYDFSGSNRYGYPDLTAKHMTHNTIIAIARHERRKGICQEELVKRLNEWLAEQNEEYLTDPLPQIRRDIDDAAKYVYGESFAANFVKEVIFTTEEIKLLLEKRPKVQRKVLFAIMVGQKKYGVMKLGADNFAAMIGFSRQGVIKAVDGLKKDGVIKVERQSAIKLGEFYLPRPNVYSIIGKAKEPDKIWVMTDELTIKTAPIKEMWIQLVKLATREEDWKRYFTAKEMEELKQNG